MTVAVYEGKKIIPSATEQACDVPENDLAKLMYYLSCVSSLISINIPSKLTDYHRYFDLERSEINKLLYYIGALSPEILLQKKIFVISDSLCTSQNNFFSFSQSDSSPIEFYIGGQRVQTFQMMACQQKWLDKNYYMPKRAYSDQILNLILSQ